jgi:hypothetical protein
MSRNLEVYRRIRPAIGIAAIGLRRRQVATIFAKTWPKQARLKGQNARIARPHPSVGVPAMTFRDRPIKQKVPFTSSSPSDVF